MQVRRHGSVAMMVSLSLLGGCALSQLADPEEAEYRRVDARSRAADDYTSFTRACREKGGIVLITSSWGALGRLSPKPPDLADVRCSVPVPEAGL